MLFLFRLFLATLLQITFFGTAYAEVNQDQRLVQNIKDISIQFQWGDLVSATHQLNPIDELDVGIAAYLLAYHQVRLRRYEDAQKIFEEAPSRSEFSKLGLANHPLHETIKKLISLRENQSSNVDQGLEKLYADYFHSNFSNEIDFYLWCKFKPLFELFAFAPNDKEHSEISDFDCEPYNQFQSVELDISGSDSTEVVQQKILQLESFYQNAPSVYEKLDILQTLGAIAGSSMQIDVFVRTSAKYSNTISKNGISDPDIIKYDLVFKQLLRAMWPNIVSSSTNFRFHEYALNGVNPQEYFETVDVIQAKLVLDGLTSEHGFFSKQVLDVLNILSRRFDYEIASTDHLSFDFFSWSVLVPRLYEYQYEIDEKRSLNMVRSFIDKWEKKNLDASEQSKFDDMPKLFASQTSFGDIERLIENEKTLKIESQSGTLISRIYLLAARHLSWNDRYNEAGPLLYKALFNLPKASRTGWAEVLLIYDELSSYHLYENKNDKLRDYFSLRIIELTAENILGAVTANDLRRFENLDEIRQAIVNSIFTLRFSYLSEIDYIQSVKLKDAMYNAIQLLRLNRITFMFTGADVNAKAQVLQMQTSQKVVRSIIENNATDTGKQFEEGRFNLGLRSLDSYQIWIPEDTAIIVAFDGWFETNFAFIDRLNFDPFFSQIDKDELAVLIEQIMASARYDAVSNSLPEFDFASSNTFYKKLFGSSYAQILMEGKKNIIFMPSKSLYNFPFTLLSNGGRLITSYDEITTYDPHSFIIDKYNISHLIEITDELIEDTFVEQLSTSPIRSGIESETFLGVANPYFGKAKAASLRGLNFVSIDEFEVDDVEFSSLPETVSEVEAASKIFDPQKSKILAGTRATKSNVLRENLSDYDVIMFSTHGLTPGEISGFEDSALVLAKDPDFSGESEFSQMLLSSDDIIETSLDADLVMMNACSTGISNTKSAPGLTGLAQSFLAAGAQSVMVSHWNVASEQTVELTELMFDALAKNQNLSYAGALQEAQVKIKNQAATQHPFYWAPFTIYNNFN